jgi:cholesterol oxidase
VSAETTHYDVLVVGSGFGGSVTALRLTEKGYSVGVLEAGRRFADEDFAKTSWRVRKFLWAPRLGLYGIQRIHLLPDVLVLCGAGVGGGSLVYANTLYVPPKEFFEDPQWAGITDWQTTTRPRGCSASPTFRTRRRSTTCSSPSPRTWAWGTRSSSHRSACTSATARA